MKNLKLMKSALIFLWLMILLPATNACLDPKQASDNCSSCEGGKELIEKMCFDRMRGCLEYKLTTDKKLFCNTCQYGYVKFGQKCERKALVEAMSSKQNKSNSPSPLRSSHINSLDAKQIKKNNENKGSQSKIPASEKMIPNIPKIEIIKTSEKIQAIQKWLKNQTNQNYNAQISSLIQFQSSQDSKTRYMEVNLQNGFKILINQNIKQNSFTKIGFFQDQKIKNIQKILKQKNINNLVVEPCIKYKFSMKDKNITLIQNYQNGLVWNVDASLYINNSKKSNFPQLYLIQQQINQKFVNQEVELNNQFKKAYQLFMKQISIINLPPKLKSIKANQFNETIKFRVEYDVKSNQQTIFNYYKKNNSVEIVGYYIQGQDVYEKSKNLSTNSTNKDENSNETIESKQTETVNPIEKQAVKKLLQNNIQVCSRIGNNFEVSKIEPENQRVSSVHILSEKGLFKMKILRHPDGKLSIIMIPGQISFAVLQSSRSCETIQENEDSSKLLPYFFKKYPILNGFDPEMIQEKLRENKKIYRFLLSNKYFQQIQILIEKELASPPKYSLKKIQLLNSGDKFVQKLNSIKLSSILDSSKDSQKAIQTKYKQFLDVINKKYEKYLKQAVVEAVLQNNENLKIYMQTSQYTLEALVDKTNKLQSKLKAIQKKTPVQPMSLAYKLGIPEQFQKSDLIRIEEDLQLYRALNKIEESLKKRYQFYLSNNFGGCMYLKNLKEKKDPISCKLICKSLFGLFEIDALLNSTTFEEINTSMIKSIPKWNSTNIIEPNCSTQYLLDPIRKNCFKRIPDCKLQISEVCIVCEKYALLSISRKQCISDCQKTISEL